MPSTEVVQVARGFCEADAAVTGASAVAGLVAGPRLAGLVKLGGAAALVWAGLEPDHRRVQIAAGVNAGLAAIDLIGLFGRRITVRQRLFRLGGAAFNAVFAVLHYEGARDLA